MRIAPFVGLLFGALLLASCIRSSSVAPQSEQQPLEQRLADLEQWLNGGAPGAPRLSEAEARRQNEHDLAEIQGMGLVERAQHDFSSRLTNATIDKWTIGYFMDTNTVWCDVRYRLPGANETLQRSSVMRARTARIGV